jgi:4-amino-4-deoxy-L-arabinose transferase-like glycosyltransferase
LTALSLSILMAVGITTFLTAVRTEDFWWADGASFALNGEFLRDYLVSGSWRHPLSFALEWFRHYPALTISLYPPIFPLTEAAIFAIFGFSHASAQAAVTLFTVIALFAIFAAMRSTVLVLAAAGAAVMLAGTPEMLRWSREIVMDVPALAFLLLAAGALLRYQADRRMKTLLAAVILTLAAAYTKQTALFVAPAFAAALLLDEGWAIVRRAPMWIAGAVGLIGLIPLAIFTVLFGAENFHIAFGSETGEPDYARLSFQGLTAYGRVLPDIVGIVPLIGSAAYLLLVQFKGWRDRPERRLALLMVAWFVIVYILISVTADFEVRYATPLTVPPVVLSTLLVTRLLPAYWAGGATLALAVCLFAVNIVAQPPLRVEGYGDVAQYILDHTEQDDVVMFHGMGSKNLSFSVRARTPDPKLSILRAEKFLVDYKILRGWGIVDRSLTEADIDAIIDRYDVSYVVFQVGFWTDQPSIAALWRVLRSDRFAPVAEFRITAEEINRRAVLLVFRNVHHVPGRKHDFEAVPLPLGVGPRQ